MTYCMEKEVKVCFSSILTCKSDYYFSIDRVSIKESGQHMEPWRSDPNLKRHFHPQYPDDIQLLVHEGSFRFTSAKPERMWATVLEGIEITDLEGKPIRAYKAKLINQPFNLKTLQMGSEILFVPSTTFQLPIRVTQEYLNDRKTFDIKPCDRCGLSELFDPVQQLIALTFPDMKTHVEEHPEHAQGIMFSSICPFCGGVMLVSHIGMRKVQDKTAPKPQNFITQARDFLKRKKS